MCSGPSSMQKKQITMPAPAFSRTALQSQRNATVFFYGGVEPIRFDVRDFRADSRGMHLSISASDPTIVDIYYMLISGNKAIYITREEAVPITGSFSTAIQKDYAWKQLLENGRDYAGRVKIVELNHNQTRAFMNTFRAREDAEITETYQDETGASATVLGNSRVPFEGKLRFILSQNAVVLNTTEKKTPVLLTGDDETVEITWNETLTPGIYQLTHNFDRQRWRRKGSGGEYHRSRADSSGRKHLRDAKSALCSSGFCGGGLARDGAYRETEKMIGKKGLSGKRLFEAIIFI